MRTIVSRECGYAQNASQSQYPNLWRGLVSWWCPSISARGGDRLLDLSGQRSHGTLTNMENDDWIVSVGLGALSFDGVNDYVRASQLHYGTGTISFHVRPSSDIVHACVGGGFSSSSGNFFGIYIGNGVTGTLTNELITIASAFGGSFRIVGYTTATRTELFDGKWHHITIVQRLANSQYEIWLDGTSRNVSNGLTALGAYGLGVNGGNVFTIGSDFISGTTSSLFTGEMDDVRFYRRPLAISEIQQLRRRGAGLELDLGQRKTAPKAEFNRRRRILTGMV
jgi:hypothetical protein